jgi:hypothetical protein
MKVFRNTGWAYYDQVQAILPNVGVRGRHAFSPLSAPPVVGGDFEEIGGDGSGNVASGSATEFIGGGSMNVGEVTLTGSAPSGAGVKRKLSNIGDVDAPRSRKSTSRSAGSRLTSSKPSPSAVTSAVSETRGSGRGSSNIAIYSIQGSINQLNDTLCRAVDKPTPLDPKMAQLARTTEAIKTLQADDGLSRKERLDMVDIFTHDLDAANVYLSLAEDWQRDWVKKTLSQTDR